MSKHTKGPWDSDGRFVSADNGNKIICRVEVTPDREGGFEFTQALKAKWAEETANINLITAAPDLLAALESCPVPQTENLNFIRWYDVVRGMAIAKATK